MKEYIKFVAKVLSTSAEEITKHTRADSCLIMLKMGEGIGMACVGKKKGFDQSTIPFMKKCIERLQQTVEATETGKISLAATPEPEGYLIDTKTGEVRKFTDSEQPDITKN